MAMKAIATTKSLGSDRLTPCSVQAGSDAVNAASSEIAVSAVYIATIPGATGDCHVRYYSLPI